MNSNEMVTVARLADHYEKHVPLEYGEDGPLHFAEQDLIRFKRAAPTLWQGLVDSKRSDREIGDWLFEFMQRWSTSGMSFKNFAAEEEERHR